MTLDLEKEALRIRLIRCLEGAYVLWDLAFITGHYREQLRHDIFDCAQKNGIDPARLITDEEEQVTICNRLICLKILEISTGHHQYMGTYYYAVDMRAKEYFSAPDKFAIEYPGCCHPSNPFPGMVVMKNCQGSHFKILDDCSNDIPPEEGYKDITEECFKEYIDMFKNP